MSISYFLCSNRIYNEAGHTYIYIYIDIPIPGYDSCLIIFSTRIIYASIVTIVVYEIRELFNFLITLVVDSYCSRNIFTNS